MKVQGVVVSSTQLRLPLVRRSLKHLFGILEGRAVVPFPTVSSRTVREEDVVCGVELDGLFGGKATEGGG
jgi:hypothetical protein